MSIGYLFLNRMKTAKYKKKTGNQLAYIIFETMRILTKYCIIREIHINILKIHVHEPVLSQIYNCLINIIIFQL